ncbi:hypothetical protein Hdeb2414_s0006g00214781 [Helianthus debilis subsp. tardiflorus]
MFLSFEAMMLVNNHSSSRSNSTGFVSETAGHVWKLRRIDKRNLSMLVFQLKEKFSNFYIILF